jgi:uncharacterized protein YndB with AHSA1/START domain
MPREFVIRKEVTLPAVPEAAWAAVTTRSGLSAWFLPMDVEPEEDGWSEAGEVLTWEPPTRLTVRSPAPEMSTSQVFDYTFSACPAGCVLRFEHQGFMGRHWEAEYSATRAGWDMYLHTLGQYLEHFAGRRATFVSAEAPKRSGVPEAWPRLLSALGLDAAPPAGAWVLLRPAGLDPIEGVADYVAPEYLGVRTADAMYRFHNRARLGMPVAVGHHLFGVAPDGGPLEAGLPSDGWREWLERVFS